VTSTGTEEDRLARAAWSALVEPGDRVAGALVALVGAARALVWVRRCAQGAADWSLLADVAGGPLDGVDRQRLSGAVARWSARLPALDPAAHLEALGRLGGALVVPGDEGWPAGLDDLGDAAPFALWARGDPSADRAAVAVVGSRAATAYGERVAYDLAEGLARRGVLVVSGGAYGVDAAAHRGALATGVTVVVLAGGVDRSYPAGNSRVFEEAVARGGALVSEVPPGALPTRSRFLLRNRLIAAWAAATVVVEAAWRSGALNTAHHAVGLLRPLGAVPGPVTSPASTGCHRLLRDGAAVCVTDVDEVLELVPGGAPADRLPSSGGARSAARDGIGEVLGETSARVHDALGLRAPAPVEQVAARAGTTLDEARGCLGLLELEGLAERRADGWVAVRGRPGPASRA